MEGAESLRNECTAGHILCQAVRCIVLVLQRDKAQPTSITVKWLDKCKAGISGASARMLARVQFVGYYHAMLAWLPKRTQTLDELSAVLAKCVQATPPMAQPVGGLCRWK